MPIVELGTSYEDVQNEDKYPVVPNGEYEFNVLAGEPATTQKGRPQIKWRFGVVDPQSGRQVQIPYNTVLPWDTPDGRDVSGVGLLVAFCKSVGLPWTGTAINTDDYIGRMGRAEVIQKPKRMQNEDGEWVNDPDPANKVNDIKKFIY